MNDDIKYKIDQKFKDYAFHSAMYIFSEDDDDGHYTEKDIKIVSKDEYNDYKEKELFSSCQILFEFDVTTEKFTPVLLGGENFSVEFDNIEKYYYLNYRNIFVEKKLFKYIFDGFSLNSNTKNLISQYINENTDILFAVAYIIMPMIEFDKSFDEEEKEYIFREIYYPKEIFIVFYQ